MDESQTQVSGPNHSIRDTLAAAGRELADGFKSIAGSFIEGAEQSRDEFLEYAAELSLTEGHLAAQGDAEAGENLDHLKGRAVTRMSEQGLNLLDGGDDFLDLFIGVASKVVPRTLVRLAGGEPA